MVKSAKPKRTYAPNITVRVSDPTKQKLREAAEAHDRSIRQEIEARIQASFEAEDLAAALLDDRSLLAPLVVFSREYGRILKLADVSPGTKLAYGLAGEVFRHTMLSFVEGTMPSGFRDDYDEERQVEADNTLRKQARDALAGLMNNNDNQLADNSHQNTITVLKQKLKSLSKEETAAPDICASTYFALHTYKDAIEEAAAAERIKSKMGWLNEAVLKTVRSSDINPSGVEKN